MIWCGLAVVDQAGKTLNDDLSGARKTAAHLLLASLTLMRGRARSSLSRWLCSESLRSLSSDVDCFEGRLLMVGASAGWECLCGGGKAR